MSFLEQLLIGAEAFTQKLLQHAELQSKIDEELQRRQIEKEEREYVLKQRGRQAEIDKRTDADYYGNLALSFGEPIAKEVLMQFLQELYENLSVAEESGRILHGDPNRPYNPETEFGSYLRELAAAKTPQERQAVIEKYQRRSQSPAIHQERLRRLNSLNMAEFQRRLRSRLESEFIKQGWDITLPTVQTAINRIVMNTTAEMRTQAQNFIQHRGVEPFLKAPLEQIGVFTPVNQPGTQPAQPGTEPQTRGAAPTSGRANAGAGSGGGQQGGANPNGAPPQRPVVEPRVNLQPRIQPPTAGSQRPTQKTPQRTPQKSTQRKNSGQTQRTNRSTRAFLDLLSKGRTA